MKVKVRYFGRVRELFGIKEEEYEIKDTSLEDLLFKYIPDRHERVAREWKNILSADEGPGKTSGQLFRGGYIVFVNGEARDMKYRLRDGDVVAILPPVGGG